LGKRKFAKPLEQLRLYKLQTAIFICLFTSIVQKIDSKSSLNGWQHFLLLTKIVFRSLLKTTKINFQKLPELSKSVHDASENFYFQEVHIMS